MFDISLISKLELILMAPKKNAQPKRKNAEIEDIDKKDQSNFSTQMAKAQKEGKLTPDQESVWSKYKAMGRFDQDKKELIAQWKNDKSCKWVDTFKRIQMKSSSVERDKISGWGARYWVHNQNFICLLFHICSPFVLLPIHRFQIADALKMDVDHAAFKTVLKHIEHDDGWDPEDPLEAIWIKMGEKRYKLSGIKSLNKAKDKEEETETIEKEATSASSGSKDLNAIAGAPPVTIKLENEKWSKLQSRLKVAKAGKGS